MQAAKHTLWVVMGAAAASLLLLQQPANAADKGAVPCVSRAADLPVLDLVALNKEKRKVVLDRKKSACLQTPEGMSVPAIRLQLPTYSEPYSISVRGVIRKTVLVPRVDMLDGGNEKRRTLGAAEVRQRADSIELSVFVNADNSAEQFMVLYPDPEALGQNAKRTSMGVQSNYIGTGTWMSGNEINAVVNYVDAGVLVVELQGAQWQKKR